MFGLGPGAIDLFQKAWMKGHVSAYEANARTMSYVAKYTLKGSKDIEPSCQIFDPNDPDRRLTVEPFRIMSLRPPIGAAYGKNIANALKTRAGTYVLNSEHVYPERNLRINGDRYPIGRTIRNHVMDGLGLPREFQSQVFYSDYEPTEEDEKAAQVQHRKALRQRHSRTKL